MLKRTSEAIMSETPKDTLQPIIVDAGKQKRKRIKQLKRGAGRLAEMVQEAAAHARAQLGDEAGDILPVVVLFEKRRKRP
jgi:hypothetical protein